MIRKSQPLIEAIKDEECDWTIKTDLQKPEDLLDKFDNDKNWKE